MTPQLEEELPLLESLVRILDRDPRAPIPHDHRAGPVLTVGDDTFEFGVFERVILGLHRQALVVLIRRGTLGDRPRQQHPVELEAQIPVERARVVLLHHEDAPARHHSSAEWLRRTRGGALFAIRREAIVAGESHRRNSERGGRPNQGRSQGMRQGQKVSLCRTGSH